jgi:glycosyltransferase involved in cell wall biosynthesis
MDWLPNEDAIMYFSERILPRIRQSLPDVTLAVVGRNPYTRLVELSKRDSSITVTGWVEDVRPYMESSSAYIVPLRIGGGTRLKIFEAMAMEMPVISTSIGAEGLPVRAGRDLLLADDPDSFADSVVRVLTDERLARQLGTQAAATVRDQFNWRNAAVKFAEVLQKAVTSRGNGRPTIPAKSDSRKVG